MTKYILIPLVFFAGFAFAQDVKEAVTEVRIGIDPANPMKYDKEAFEVKAGAKVKLTFENTGPLPKIAAGHNVVILQKGLTGAAWAPAVGAASMQVAQGIKEEYLTDEQKKQVIAYTKILGPKEKDVVEFTAPAEAGVYEYVCTFIAHFATMKGKMTVVE